MKMDLKSWRRRGGRTALALVAICSVTSLAVAQQCRIPANGTVFVRAPLGNLLVDTTGTDSVDVDVPSPMMEVQVNCFNDRVEITGVAPERVYEAIDWRIRTPESVHLDLMTFAGTIRVANTSGDVTARTTGGSVFMGNIGGNAAMITQGGSISVNNIAGNAELRSEGGQIQIGDVGGSAELETQSGPITAGVVTGELHAETAGGNINIREARGRITAITMAGDIIVGAAGTSQLRTGGGNIVSGLARGPFQGYTDIGNIEVRRAQGSVEAIAGAGDIDVQLTPRALEDRLEVTLQTNSGNIRLRMPEAFPADVEAIVDRTVLQRPSIRSDFPLESVGNRPGNLPQSLESRSFVTAPSRSVTVRNGGGNPIRLRTAHGAIELLSIGR